jgi:hypothetical protein
MIVGYCSVPTRLEVTETSTTVEIAAFQRDMTDDACPLIGEAVFVALQLEGGLRGREVVDATNKQPGLVVDCVTDPLPGWCIPSGDYDSPADPNRREFARRHKGDHAKGDRRDRDVGTADDRVR